MSRANSKSATRRHERQVAATLRMLKVTAMMRRMGIISGERGGGGRLVMWMRALKDLSRVCERLLGVYEIKRGKASIWSM
jgi:hypothetical protein